MADTTKPGGDSARIRPQGVTIMNPTKVGRFGWLGLAAVSLLAASPVLARPLSVEIWTDRGDDAVYHPGEAMQVKARTNDDAYLLVYEIDSNGRITVLYPYRRNAGPVEAKRTYRLPPENANYELAVESETGEGFLVAIASRTPFRDLPWYLRPVDPQAETIGYDDERADDEEGFDADGKVVGDPMVAMERIRRRVLGRPSDTDAFATSYTQYYVGHEVRYPRYVCNDCHRPNHYAFWDGFDPYYAQCSVVDFRVNWNWAWGPTCWNGYVPYYYYVVRPGCPPAYRRWYDDHSRWSSWDGWNRWNNLWGGSLTRHKSPPPPGYIPPTPKGGWAGGAPPPGYMTTTFKRDGAGGYLPVGHNQRVGDGGNVRTPGEWRTPSGRPSGGEVPGRVPVTRVPASEQPSGRPWREPTVRPEPPRYSPPGDEGSAPSQRPREQVHRDPPRQEPPQQDTGGDRWRSAPPREPARQDPPRQESRHENPPPPPSSSGGNPQRGHGGESKGEGGGHHR